jgi:putative tryptophan/tyrosine transport system substrate-binding protein
MNRKLHWLLTVLFLACVHPAEAQQPAKVPKIGYLAASSRDEPFVDAFRQGLRELGYIESQNIVIEYRFADGKFDRLPQLTAELLQLKVDIIVTAGGNATQVAQKATTTIPIV